MTQESNYVPPKVWAPKNDLGGKWGSINQPTAGARYDEALPRGKNPLQLYSLATPNGIKVGIMLEELLAIGKAAQYDAHIISISKGEQFSSGFVEVNPNSKIPALLDTSLNPELAVFESGSILLYLAEKFDAFLSKETHQRTTCLSWLFWQMGSGPYLGGGFGHFYQYAPEKIEYCIDRFSMEAKRQFDVLDKQLAKHQFIAGDEYTIADMAIFPWYGGVALDKVYQAAEFLGVDQYKHLMRWTKEINSREAVKKGMLVCKNK